MTIAPYGIAGARCALVVDGTYPDVLIALLDRAVRRCLVSMFIVDFSQVSRSALIDILDALDTDLTDVLGLGSTQINQIGQWLNVNYFHCLLITIGRVCFLMTN